MNLIYKLHLQKASEGGFTVVVPSLPGCITEGDTLEEAVARAKEAIEIYIEELKDRGEVVPDDKDTFEYSLNLVA
jgi:antitoxin HicB